jgi:hypothetical protein
MKVRFILKAVAFLISGLFMLSACNKDQKLIADIEGEYKIESLMNYRNGEGTPAIFTGGRIFFSDCTMKDGIGGNCEGWYEFEGGTKVTFQYNTRKEKGFNLIAITNLSSSASPSIIGSFKFEKDGNDVILNGIEESGGADGTTTRWYSDIRLSK